MLLRVTQYVGAVISLAASIAFAADNVPPLRGVTRFAYQLQKLDVKAASASPAQMLVTDPAAADKRLTGDDVKALQHMPDGSRRIVLAYLSIGEAEDYRPYWRAAWKQKPPAFLGAENPDWPGNYKVKYWDPAWQSLIVGTPESSLDQILADGYDGVYLDIIDAFETWEGTVPDARQKMIAWVKKIAEYGRAKHPGFLVVPQNGAALGEDAHYLKLVDGIGREDLFFIGDKRQPREDTQSGVKELKPFVDAGKPVFLIEYCTKPDNRSDVRTRAAKEKYVPLFCPRELDALTVSPVVKE